MRICPDCGNIVVNQICPQCGHIFVKVDRSGLRYKDVLDRYKLFNEVRYDGRKTDGKQRQAIK